MGRRLGDPADPLLVSVRSGAKFSMPGMMDTVLNLGLNDKSVKGLAAATERRALRLRLVPPVHLDVRAHRARTSTAPCSSTPSRRPRQAAGVTSDADLPAAALKELCTTYKAVVKEETGKAVPAGPDQAAARRRRGGVPQLERRQGDRLPRP